MHMMTTELLRFLETAKRTISDIGVWFLFFLVIYAILILKVITYDSLEDHLIFGFYSILITTYILSRFVISYFHKPVTVDIEYEPTVTFVVPAKNEEDNIRETVRRFGRVEYPKEKIEVIVIND